MRKAFRGLAAAGLLFVLAACGEGGSGNRLITRDGVGTATFGQEEIPNLGRGFTVRPDTAYFDSDEGFPYYEITDRSGGTAVKVFPDESIEVYSADFKTEAGIHPGMKLHEAAAIAGAGNLNIWLGWPNNYFTIEDQSSGLAWNVYGDQLAGGWEEFQRYSDSGKEVTLDRFDPEARIAWITVVNENEEE